MGNTVWFYEFWRSTNIQSITLSPCLGYFHCLLTQKIGTLKALFILHIHPWWLGLPPIWVLYDCLPNAMFHSVLCLFSPAWKHPFLVTSLPPLTPTFSLMIFVAKLKKQNCTQLITLLLFITADRPKWFSERSRNFLVSLPDGFYSLLLNLLQLSVSLRMLMLLFAVSSSSPTLPFFIPPPSSVAIFHSPRLSVWLSSELFLLKSSNKTGLCNLYLHFVFLDSSSACLISKYFHLHLPRSPWVKVSHQRSKISPGMTLPHVLTWDNSIMTLYVSKLSLRSL